MTTYIHRSKDPANVTAGSKKWIQGIPRIQTPSAKKQNRQGQVSAKQTHKNRKNSNIIKTSFGKAEYDQTKKTTNIRSGNIRNPRLITCKRKININVVNARHLVGNKGTSAQ
jgi:riboflavin biosynthesis pyrimidine reductase